MTLIVKDSNGNEIASGDVMTGTPTGSWNATNAPWSSESISFSLPEGTSTLRIETSLNGGDNVPAFDKFRIQ